MKQTLNKYQNFDISAYTSELFLEGNSPDVQISKEIAYKNPHIICRNLSITQGSKQFIEFQNDCFEQFLKILHYNAVYSLLNNLNHEKLVFAFLRRLTSAAKKEKWSTFDDLIFDQKQLFLTLFKATYAHLNFEETKTHFFENLLNKIDLLWQDYVFVLRKKGGKLQMHEITNAETAFFIKVISSSIHEVVTIYPSVDGRKMKSVKEFVDTVKKERLERQEVIHKIFDFCFFPIVSFEFEISKSISSASDTTSKDSSSSVTADRVCR